MGKIESNTPYDDVCRTLVVEYDDLVIPLINELFGEHYSLSDRIIRRGNEHFIEQTGGAEDKPYYRRIGNDDEFVRPQREALPY